jgi:hypothetical protein
MINTQIKNRVLAYIGTMSLYGFYRGITFTHKYYKEDEDDILLSDRLISGVFTGIMYANPLLHPLYIRKLMDRIEIKLKDKDPSKYISAYHDFYYNNKTI